MPPFGGHFGVILGHVVSFSVLLGPFVAFRVLLGSFG